jgi:FtsP/CotA-like multicopper oxidase with cupredoxin domain
VYRKVMYREFTDASFTTRVAQPPHLGFLGPTLRAEEGDTIRVVFKNLAVQCGRNFSVHPHGVLYTKGNEGKCM